MRARSQNRIAKSSPGLLKAIPPPPVSKLLASGENAAAHTHSWCARKTPISRQTEIQSPILETGELLDQCSRGQIADPDLPTAILETEDGLILTGTGETLRKIDGHGNSIESFGVGGQLRLGLNEDAAVLEIESFSNGDFLVVGREQDISSNAILTVLFRVRADGSVVQRADINDVTDQFETSFANRLLVAVDQNDQVTVAGRSVNGNIHVLRLSSDLSVDPRFGDGGVALIRFAPVLTPDGDSITQIRSSQLVLDSQDRMLVSEPIAEGFSGILIETGSLYVRINPDGCLDHTL